MSSVASIGSTNNGVAETRLTAPKSVDQSLRRVVDVDRIFFLVPFPSVPSRSVPFPSPSRLVASCPVSTVATALSLLYRVSRGRDAWRVCARSIGRSVVDRTQPKDQRTNERASTCKRAQRAASERTSVDPRENAPRGETTRRFLLFRSVSGGTVPRSWRTNTLRRTSIGLG